MNIFQIISQIKSGRNPEQIIVQFLEQSDYNNNPILMNLISLAKQGKGKEIEDFARNIAKSQGIDFDKEFSQFKNQFGL